MNPNATPRHMRADAQERRRAAARLFDRAAQSFDEACASAEAMTSTMELEGRLMHAPLLYPCTTELDQHPD